MIVKCEQCQTRFKIPDDKVTDKGVKVRCTKCQHTFRVKKEGGAATETLAAASAPREADPFAKFGAGADSGLGEATRPGVFALGVAATRGNDPLKPSFAAQADLPSEVFEAQTRIAPLPAPPPGRRSLTEMPVARHQPAPAPGPLPFDFSQLSPSSDAGDKPFDFSSLDAPVETTQRASMPPGPAASAFEPQPFDFSVLESKPVETTQKVPMPMAPAPQAPSAFEPQPFDFSALDPAAELTEGNARPLPPARPAPPPSAFEPRSFDFSQPSGDVPFEFAAPSPPHPAPPPALPPKPTVPPALPAPRRSAAAPARPPPPPPAEPSPPAAPSLFEHSDPFSAAGPPGAGLLGDLPDPFAEQTRPEVPAVDEPSGDLDIDIDDGLSASREERGSLFDMGAPPPSTGGRFDPGPGPVDVPAPTFSSAAVPLARIALKKASAVDVPVALEAPAGGGARRVLGLVCNALFAAVILVVVSSVGAIFLNDGKVDGASFSWARLKSVLSQPHDWVAFDITNGLYETRAGRPVFFVRGEVKNRGSRGGRVKVRAEIFDGEDLVRAAEGWVGASPSPEDLFGIATADDLTRLSDRLAATAATVAPGAQAPFLLTFYEYPPELKGFRVKVTVVSEADHQTAAR